MKDGLSLLDMQWNHLDQMKSHGVFLLGSEDPILSIE
jgi:hypothetical protein